MPETLKFTLEKLYTPHILPCIWVLFFPKIVGKKQKCGGSGQLLTIVLNFISFEGWQAGWDRTYFVMIIVFHFFTRVISFCINTKSNGKIMVHSKTKSDSYELSLHQIIWFWPKFFFPLLNSLPLSFGGPVGVQVKQFWHRGIVKQYTLKMISLVNTAKTDRLGWFC